LPDTSDCGHYSLILANKKGDFKDPLVLLYICLRCGTPQLVCPVNHFENNEVAKAQLLQMAKEIQLPKLNRKQKRELMKKSTNS